MRRVLVGNPFVAFAAAGEPPGSVDVRATDVAYAQVIGPAEFGNNWDKAFPVASGTNRRVSGMRFALDVPQGRTITTATLDVTHSQNATWVSPADNLTVFFELADSTTLATNVADADAKTTGLFGTVNWAISGYKSNGAVLTAPDLAALLQVIVDRPGWVSGNYATVWLLSTGGGNDAHQIWAVTGVTETSKPRLRVEYT